MLTRSLSTIGKLCRHLLTDIKYHGTMLPRIPVPIARDIEKKIADHDRENRGRGGGKRSDDRQRYVYLSTLYPHGLLRNLTRRLFLSLRLVGIEAAAEIGTNEEMKAAVLSMIEIDVDLAVVAHIVVNDPAIVVETVADTIAATASEIVEIGVPVLATSSMTIRSVVDKMMTADETDIGIVLEIDLTIEAIAEDHVQGITIADVETLVANSPLIATNSAVVAKIWMLLYNKNLPNFFKLLRIAALPVLGTI